MELNSTVQTRKFIMPGKKNMENAIDCKIEPGGGGIKPFTTLNINVYRQQLKKNNNSACIF